MSIVPSQQELGFSYHNVDFDDYMKHSKYAKAIEIRTFNVTLLCQSTLHPTHKPFIYKFPINVSRNGYRKLKNCKIKKYNCNNFFFFKNLNSF